jgi:hypothetical protein
MDNFFVYVWKKAGRQALIAVMLCGMVATANAQTASVQTKTAKTENSQTTDDGIRSNATALPMDAWLRDRETVNVGLFYPISTNGRQAKQCVNSFSLNALVGLSAAETGFTLAGLSNIICDSAAGLQIAGFSNHIGNHARGTQLAGFMNYINGTASGAQIAGFMNFTGRSSGVNIAGFGNINRKNASGVQVSGFINSSEDAGVQVGGFINHAKDVHTQVAGFINVARKVKGAQVAGFINIADSSDYPIGIINIIKNGEMTVGVSTDESLTTVLTFRSGGRLLYGIAGIGYNHKGARELAAWEAGIGGHVLRAGSFRLNAEIVHTGLTDFKNGSYLRSSLRILPAYRFASRMEIFAGPTFNYVFCDKGQGADLRTNYLWSEIKNGRDVYGLYFGVTAGVQVRL